MDMDDIPNTLLEQSGLADQEQLISHLQVEVEYHKKLLWSNDVALKNEEKNLKKLQTEYREQHKDQEGEKIWKSLEYFLNLLP